MTTAGRIVDVTVSPLDVPLREPFEISLGVQTAATNVLVTVETTEGVVGFGEGSPIGPVTGETQTAALATGNAATDLLVGESVLSYRQLVADVRSAFPGNPSVLFALETAVLDAYCRLREIPLSELFGGHPTPVETDLTIGITDPADAAAQASRAVETGFTHLKLKTGTTVDEDVRRVTAVAREAPEATLKVDANQAWTPKQSIRFASRVAEENVRLALIEQPVPAADVTGLARVTDSLSVPVAADESVFDPADALRVISMDAADILNLKLGKSGPLAAAAIVALAEAAELELMIGCMLETAVGVHTAAHFVAGTGAFQYVDLDANRLLAEDVVATNDGPMHEPSGPGHGITPADEYRP